MIRVTFLGVGAALPVPGGTNSAYLIEIGGATVLFDCGPAILQQLAAVDRTPGDVTHVYVSHSHGDHALGWPMFRLWWVLRILEGVKKVSPPPLIASTATLAHLAGLWAHTFDDVPKVEFPTLELPTHEAHTFALTPGVTVTTRPMIHSTVYPVLGARFEAEGKVLAFTADTARCDEIVPLARGADLLVHDAAHALTVRPRKAAQGRFHCAARDAGEYAEEAGAKLLALIHISAEYAGKEAKMAAEAKTRYGGEVIVPKPGDTVTV